MYYTYILQSESTGRLYIGQSSDPEKRLDRHNKNHNTATRNRGPWVSIFTKAFETRSEAVMLEKKLKAFKNPEKVKRWIAAQL